MAVGRAVATEKEGLAVIEIRAELVCEPRLANPGLADDVGDSHAARRRLLPTFLQGLDLAPASDQLGKSTATRDIEAADACLDAIEPPKLLRLCLALDRMLAVHEALDQRVGRLAHQDSAAVGLGFDPRRQVHRVAERRDRHLVLVAKGAHHQWSAVQANAKGRPCAMLGLDLFAHDTHSRLDIERRTARPYRGVLDRHRRAEKCHHPVAGQLLDGAVVGVHGFAQLAMQPLHQEVVLLLAQLPGERRVTSHVGEQHCHLPALRGTRSR